VSVMPLAISPAEGVPSHQSTWKAHGVWSRLAGLGLALIALGPILVITAGIVFTVFAVTDLVRHTSAGIATVAGIVESQISPQIAKIESAFNGLAAPLSEFEDSVSHAMTAFEQLGNIQIAKGAWGSTPSLDIKIPPTNLDIGDITIEVPHVGLDGVRMEKETKSIGSIENGSLFNKATPSVPIPPAPIALPMEPLQKALAPLGSNGPIGKAFKAAQSEVEGAMGDIGKLRQPILAIRDGVAGLLAPLEAALAPILAALFVVLVAVVAQVLLCVAGILYLIRTRPTELATKLITGIPFGLLGYCHRALVQWGFSMLFGRPQARPERLIDDLRTRAERLQSEIATLRADFLSPGALAVTRVP
jgi:hypothetical protein